MSKKQKKAYPLRISDEMREWIRCRAFGNRRSINTELNVMIEIAREAIEKKELKKQEFRET